MKRRGLPDSELTLRYAAAALFAAAGASLLWIVAHRMADAGQVGPHVGMVVALSLAAGLLGCATTLTRRAHVRLADLLLPAVVYNVTLFAALSLACAAAFYLGFWRVETTCTGVTSAGTLTCGYRPWWPGLMTLAPCPALWVLMVQARTRIRALQRQAR